jgi:hypothetical protein
MTISTTDRNTPRRARGLISMQIAAGAVVHNGLIAVVNATGFVEEGAVGTDLVYTGRFEETVDNSAGADGDLSVLVRTPSADAFLWANDSVNPVLQAQIGLPCYILDNQTVAATDLGGTLSKAGVVVEITDDGVWVE